MSMITIIRSTYGKFYEILYDGEYYEADKIQIESLLAGVSPKDLGLKPFDENEEPEVTFDDHRGDGWMHWGRV